MTERRAKLIAAIDCCMQNDACDQCPLMDEFCDMPFTDFVQLPVMLVDAVMREMRGQEGVKPS